MSDLKKVLLNKTKGYKKGVEDAIKALGTVHGSCLCGHFDACSGGCRPSSSDYVEAVKKLLKSNK